MRRTMLQRLKRADGPVKLATGREIVDRLCQTFLGRTQHLGSKAGATGIEHMLKHRIAGTCFTDKRIEINLDPNSKGNASVRWPNGCFA